MSVLHQIHLAHQPADSLMIYFMTKEGILLDAAEKSFVLSLDFYESIKK
ncbi:MAG: hypothetical protein V1753_10855 [Pseudomonadota bacterium]